MSPCGVSMEERNDEWGAGCAIDGGECIGCGDCEGDDLAESSCAACGLAPCDCAEG